MLTQHAAPSSRLGANIKGDFSASGHTQRANIQVPEAEQWTSPRAEEAQSPEMNTDVNSWSLNLAVDVLDAVTRNFNAINDPFHRRAQVLRQHAQANATEAPGNDHQQRAYVEHLHATIQELYAELERLRRSVSSAPSPVESPHMAPESTALAVSMPPVVSSNAVATRKPATSTAITRSPLAARVAPSSPRHQIFGKREPEWTNVLGRSAEQHVVKNNIGFLPELEMSQKELQAAAKLVSTREGKLKEILKEKAYWQQEYQQMREQVVAEKMRQVELFHRLETHKREHLRRCEGLERALRDAQHENELFKSQLAEAQVKLEHQRNTLSEVLRHSKEEKESLVCTIAETRHKFKEWKDGEALTLKAARDQAVHTLKTEYELKIARHHLEKQKLRDKVKDLEVSLRLLQKDRHLSPQELSLRKATILGSPTFATTSEAELIEAHCRIKELEALLDHAKEYQKRQENIIKMSEGTIAKLEQEREVVALEYATMLQPRNVLSSFDVRSPSVVSPLTSPNGGAKFNRRASKPSQSSDTKGSNSRVSGGNASMLALNSSPSTTSFKLGQDAEKEHLRRQSIVLSAEVEKYRHMVVTSLDEIRSLRDNRRRSLMSSSGSNNANGNSLLSAREQYLMNELAKVQKELDSMKEGGRKSKKVIHEKLGEDTSSESEDSEDSSSESDSNSDADGEEKGKESTAQNDSEEVGTKSSGSLQDQDAAVKVIQKRSKGFLLRRDFIRKKRAIDKIKAQYRGYLVRKNMELLERTRRPFVVTEGMQVKMQLTDVHHELETIFLDQRLRLEIRVSKDPPIVQIVLHEIPPTSASLEIPTAERPSRVYFFHFFEIVALMPLSDETRVLERSSPSDIAQLIGSLLELSMAVGEYKFRINRMLKHRQEGSLPPLLPAVTGSYLTPLLVQVVSPPPPLEDESQVVQPSIGEPVASVAREDDDLDVLIRLSRCPSTELKDVVLSSPTTTASELTIEEDSSVTSLSRLSRRRSSSLEPIPEKILI